MEANRDRRVIAIAAMGEGRVLSDAETGIPWDLPRDRAFFRQQTQGEKLLLGRVTYDEMRGWFREGHLPCVVSRTPEELALADLHHLAARAVESAITALHERRSGPIFVCGGAAIYQAALPLCDELLLTRVEGQFNGDRFFPAWESEFQRVSQERFEADEENAYAMRMERWIRLGG